LQVRRRGAGRDGGAEGRAAVDDDGIHAARAFGISLAATPSGHRRVASTGAVRPHHSGDLIMPRGDKSAYTDKQQRQAEHIEEGYEKRGTSKGEAERRAWATVNKMGHGGKRSGSGRGKGTDTAPARKGGRLGGKAAARRPAAKRSASARKAARTRNG
jgi:plasmid stabilization system protein ParE